MHNEEIISSTIASESLEEGQQQQHQQTNHPHMKKTNCSHGRFIDSYCYYYSCSIRVIDK